MNGDNRLRFLTIAGVFAAAMLAIVILMAMNTSATIIGDPYPGNGDWIINQDTTVIDESIDVYDGDIILNANLRVWNSYINFELVTDSDYHALRVPAGRSLQSNDSTFESLNDFFNVDIKGTLITDNVDFNWMNWTLIGGTALCNDTHLYYVLAGLQINANMVYNNGTMMYIYGGFNITGTTSMFNTRAYNARPGLILSGASRLSYCTFELQYDTMTWSSLISTDNCTFQNIYEWNITGTTSLVDAYMFRINYGFNMPGTVTISNSYMAALYNFNASGTVTVYNTTHNSIYNGMILSGIVSIDLSTYWYNSVGVFVSNDAVTVTNTRFINMYDSGFHFDDCDASLNNVTIDVFRGTTRGYFSTGDAGTGNDRFTMAMGIGISVIGGAPTFVDVDVEADSYAEFHMEYTGSEQETWVYTRAIVAAVLIDSTEMRTVSGLTIHDSYMYQRHYVDATNPGMNPRYLWVEVEVYSAGLAVVDYSNITISDVDSYRNRRGSVYGPYISGTAWGGSGYRYYRDQFQVATGVFGDYTSSPSPMLTVRDIEVDDGSDWYGHMYKPSYSGPGVPRFENTVLIENITVDMSWDHVFSFEIGTTHTEKRALVSDVRITNSHFEGLYRQMLRYYIRAGEGIDPTQNKVDIDETFTFDNNTITESFYSWTYLDIGTSGGNMPNDRWDKTVTIADNEFTDSTGGFFYTYGLWDFVRGSETFNFLNNIIDNTTDTNDGPFFIYQYDTIVFEGNQLTDMFYGRTADIYDNGGSNAGVKASDWLFKDNTWDNCTNTDWPEVMFLEFGGDVEFTGNEVMNQYGLISIMPWMEYSGYASMDINNNTFHDNMNYFVEYGEPEADFPAFDMMIVDNEAYNNEDFFVNYWGSDSILTNFDWDGTFVIKDNNFHDNNGGIIHAWGDVSVMGNTFTNNAGPLLHIDYINLNVPSVSNNAMVNNGDLFLFEAKDRGYQLVAMGLSQQTLTCTGTALAVTNMEVTLDGVDIVGASTSILAWNSFVNAYSSNIDGDTCEVVADGMITTWRPVEVYVTWGDKDGMDSGTPVSEALVVFNTASGDYYTSDYAGTDGMMAQELYREWSVDLAGVYWYSPYNMKVAAAGATNDTTVTLDMDLIGQDMVHLILWDVFPPVVAIAEPFDGAVFAKDTLEAFGFVAEVGSGLETVEYSTNGGVDWMDLTIDPSGDWTISLSGLDDGPMTIMVKAMDVAGNSADTEVMITIDTTPPALSINALPEITNVPDVTITGTVEMGAEVFLNGRSLGNAQDMVLAIDHVLHEGVNVIVIEAKDMAGNMAMETITIELDTFEPVLVVTGPATNTITNEDSITVTGIVEVGATLTVGGTQVVPDETGVFSYDYDLASGDNTIEVKATDAATNENMVTIMVHQDQDPPSVEITDPDDGHITDMGLIQVTIEADDDAQLWLNGRMLTETGSVTINILLVEGENTITARAEDMAGNVATDTIMVTRDTEPPSLVVTMPEVMEVWTNAAALEIEGVALKATTVKAGGVSANLDEDTGVFTVSVPLSVGVNNITVEASDGVNVVSELLTVNVNRDSPTLNVDTVEPTIKTSSVTITGNTEAGIETVGINYDGTNTIMFPVEYDGTFSVTLSLADGTYDVTVSVVDEYGNTAERSTGGFTVKDKGLREDTTDDGGFTFEPLHLGLILAVIGIALIIAAYASAHSITQRKREELEESD